MCSRPVPDALALAAYHRYVRRPRPARYALVAACFVLGLMAKPMLVTLPFLLLLLDFWPLGGAAAGVRGTRALRPGRDWCSRRLPLFALAAASSRHHARGAEPAAPSRRCKPSPRRRGVANAASSSGGYLVKTIWPAAARRLLPLPATERHGRWGAAAARRRSRAVASAADPGATPVSRGGVALVPAGPWCRSSASCRSGVQSMADRYTYIPLTGIFIDRRRGSLASVSGAPPAAGGRGGGCRCSPRSAAAGRSPGRHLALQPHRCSGTPSTSPTDNAMAHRRPGQRLLPGGSPADAEMPTGRAPFEAVRIPETPSPWG